jgi:hypothetical protein
VTHYNRSLVRYGIAVLAVVAALTLLFGVGCAQEPDPILPGDLEFTGEFDVDTGEIAEYLKQIVELQPRPELYTFTVDAYESVSRVVDTDLYRFSISLTITVTANEDILIRDAWFDISSVWSGGTTLQIAGRTGKRLFDAVQAGGTVELYLFDTWDVDQSIMDGGYKIHLELDIDRDI